MRELTSTELQHVSGAGSAPGGVIGTVVQPAGGSGVRIGSDGANN